MRPYLYSGVPDLKKARNALGPDAVDVAIYVLDEKGLFPKTQEQFPLLRLATEKRKEASTPSSFYCFPVFGKR